MTDIPSSSQPAGVAQLVEFQPSKLAVEGSNPFSRSKLGLMPTAGRVVCNHIVWVRFPQCPPNKQKNKVVMKEVLSGTLKSRKVNFVQIENNSDFLSSLRKKIKKRISNLKKTIKFVKKRR